MPTATETLSEFEASATNGPETDTIDPELKNLVVADMEGGEKDLSLSAASEVEPISNAGMDMATKSLLEVELILSNNGRVLNSAIEKLHEAQTTFSRISAAHNFRTPEEHAARMQEYLPRLEAAEDEVLSIIDDLDKQTRAIAEATSFPREPKLSDEDMKRASSMREFTREDCAELPFVQLQDKLQKVVAANDPVQAWLYVRYANQRLSEPLQENPYTKEDGTVAYNVTPATRAAQQQCYELVKHLSLRLSDTRVPKINQAAKDLAQKVREFSREAGERRNQVNIERMRSSPSYNLL